MTLTRVLAVLASLALAAGCLREFIQRGEQLLLGWCAGGLHDGSGCGGGQAARQQRSAASTAEFLPPTISRRRRK